MEGSIASIMWGIFDSRTGDDDSLSLGFGQIFTVVKEDRPKSNMEFWTKWVARYGATPGLVHVYNTYGIVVDYTPPGPVGSLISPTHATAAWSNVNIVTVNWTAASDEVGGSGLDGYSILWDQNAGTLPDTTKDIEENVAATASFALSPSSNWYFHISPKDNAGNLATATHLGPFWVDASPPAAPVLLSPSLNARLPFTTPTFTWGAVSDISGATYTFQVDNNNEFLKP